MKIAYDAKKIVKNVTGIGNYSRGVIAALDRYYPDNEYLLCAPSKKDTEAKRRLAPSDSIKYVYPNHTLPLIGEELWRINGIVSSISRLGVDIFHGLSNELPFGIDRADCKSVVTIHDLIFLRLPGTYSSSAKAILKLKTKYACRHADHIIAISECTKRDIMHYYDIPADKISVVYQGCDPIFAQKASAKDISDAMNRYGISGNYVLSVGTFEDRKNQGLCVEAMQWVEPGTTLVLVGKSTPYIEGVKNKIEKYGVGDRVKILSNVPQSDLPLLYQGCKAFLYVSKYEGFGIPILEAMTSGVPVIAATGSCLEEVAADAALYCAPDDAMALARHINHIINDPADAIRRVEVGMERTALFTPERIADEMMNVYRRVIAS